MKNQNVLVAATLFLSWEDREDCIEIIVQKNVQTVPKKR